MLAILTSNYFFFLKLKKIYENLLKNIFNKNSGKYTVFQFSILLKCFGIPYTYLNSYLSIQNSKKHRKERWISRIIFWYECNKFTMTSYHPMRNCLKNKWYVAKKLHQIKISQSLY
ncbi:hypothetical protein BpHYR1_049901 [Brachionus plicatilis]|uniref:Uncharacterized protein n=1 Tax=Brachionus plicatilis TaxID=10195 RepID=A0A3M7QGC8_BRAPC|nr:hypothetical protein BpHYR1_049901 [Brachionus plicatilis]